MADKEMLQKVNETDLEAFIDNTEAKKQFTRVMTNYPVNVATFKDMKC